MEALKGDSMLSGLWPSGFIPQSAAHPPFFYYLLSWSNCKPTRDGSAIINSSSWKRTRHIIVPSATFTRTTVPPRGHACPLELDESQTRLTAEQEGARRERSRKQFPRYKVAEKLKAAAFRLAAKWICNYFIYFNKIKLKPTELGLLISVRAQWGNKNGHSLWTHNYWRQKWSPALLSIIKMLNTEEIFIKYNLSFILLHLILAVCFSVFLQPI